MSSLTIKIQKPAGFISELHLNLILELGIFYKLSASNFNHCSQNEFLIKQYLTHKSLGLEKKMSLALILIKFMRKKAR
jgi:hypothetical protein